jgi:predicted CopG family antitoxin
MATLTIPVDDEFYQKIQELSWIRWSRVVQEGIRKRKILEIYIRNNTISESDASFCESIDWHPVDELPVKKEVIDKIKSEDKSCLVKVKDVADIFR